MRLDELFLAVYDNPADDVCRFVLADALLERGDARGELIMLQYQHHSLAKKRAAKLIERHRARFLGALSHVVVHGSDRWERGFLVSCTARLSGDTGQCPAWATVRRVEVVASHELDPTELASGWMRSLTAVRVREAQRTAWGHLYPSGRARVEHVLTSANRLHLLAA